MAKAALLLQLMFLLFLYFFAFSWAFQQRLFPTLI
jgi:hypothetical protein